MPPYDDELALVKRVLEVYDQKYVADFLNEISKGDRCRETVNRWVNGKASPA